MCKVQLFVHLYFDVYADQSYYNGLPTRDFQNPLYVAGQKSTPQTCVVVQCTLKVSMYTFVLYRFEK